MGVSPSRLHGAPVRSVHRGYDRDGSRVPLADAWEVVVETESEWTDADRLKLLALARYDAGVCACGFHRDIASDDDNTFMPVVESCPVCAGQDTQRRVLESQDESFVKANEGADPMRPRPWDGRHLRMRFVPPDEAERLRGGGSSG